MHVSKRSIGLTCVSVMTAFSAGTAYGQALFEWEWGPSNAYVSEDVSFGDVTDFDADGIEPTTITDDAEGYNGPAINIWAQHNDRAPYDPAGSGFINGDSGDNDMIRIRNNVEGDGRLSVAVFGTFDSVAIDPAMAEPVVDYATPGGGGKVNRWIVQTGDEFFLSDEDEGVVSTFADTTWSSLPLDDLNISNLNNLEAGTPDWDDLTGFGFYHRRNLGSAASGSRDFELSHVGLTYIPEPASLALLGLGGGLIMLRRSRRDLSA